MGLSLDVGTDADNADCVTGTLETAIGLFVIVSHGIEDADGEADVGISEGLSGSAVPSSVGTEPNEGVQVIGTPDTIFVVASGGAVITDVARPL